MIRHYLQQHNTNEQCGPRHHRKGFIFVAGFSKDFLIQNHEHTLGSDWSIKKYNMHIRVYDWLETSDVTLKDMGKLTGALPQQHMTKYEPDASHIDCKQTN